MANRIFQNSPAGGKSRREEAGSSSYWSTEAERNQSLTPAPAFHAASKTSHARTLVAFLWAIALLGPPRGLAAEEVSISVRADQRVGPVARFLTGACIEDVNHEIYGGLYSQMIFGEAFQEPPPAPSLKGFKAFGGRRVVREGELNLGGADGPKLVSESAPFTNGAAGVELFFADPGEGNAGLIVRVARPGLGADRFTGYEVSLDPARQVLRLGRHRNNYELIQDVACEVATGRWVSLEVRLSGPFIEVLVDGKTVLRHDDGPKALAAGTVGLRTWQREARFRRLLVRSGERIETLAFAATEEFPEVSGMWRAMRRGDAAGGFDLVSERPFAGAQSQALRFGSGAGEWGLENQGLNRAGMNVVAGKPYEGSVWARANRPVTLVAAMESRDGSRVYAERPLTVSSPEWQRLDFTLTPDAADRTGRFTLKLKQPGAVELGYASLQPGDWGRFKGLPVRRDVAEALVDQGVTVLRYGGSMVNHDQYKWKQMIGPRDRRPPYPGTWYRYSSNGWGILDFMDFCEAAGFEYVPDFNLGETPQDMADFIEYAKGVPDSEWGRRRAADGHREPYRLRYLELGNEERVDENYFAKFKALAEAIWAKDPSVIIVVGDFFYHRPIADPFHFEGGAVNTLAAHQKILDLAKAHDREVWFDIHVDTEAPPAPGDLAGPRSFIDQLGRISPGARYRVVIFELNAGNHAQRRALANALATNAVLRDGRFPIVTSANCLQPDGQNDNGWDQGLLFLNPSQVWLQPPGYVTRMFAQNRQSQQVRCEMTGAEGRLDVTATRSEDGRTLVLHVVNPGAQPLAAELRLSGYVPQKPAAQVTELSGPLNAVNTADAPDTIVPQSGPWGHALKDGTTSRVFSPHSFTVIRFD